MSIQSILGTDVIKDSRAVINANFTHLEDTKATGPASATDNAVARFDATTGKLLQNSPVTVGDSGNIVTTIPDASNVAGITINQNDVTNTPNGMNVLLAYGGTGMLFETTNDANFNGFGPTIDFRYSATQVSNAGIGGFQFYGDDSADVDTLYGKWNFYIGDHTDGSEDSNSNIETMLAGTRAVRFEVGNNINGVGVGATTAAGILTSRGNQDLILQTGNATTGDITIVDGANGNITVAPHGTGAVVADTNTLRVTTAKTPASATAAGTTGDIAWDADYIYVCTATNTWKRTAIATW